MSVQIITGDCRTVLPTLPAESVDCVVTSPPYFGLRDYGVAGQIGLEESLDAYIAELVEVFDQVRRVLRPDGTLWLNHGDSYATNGGAGLQGTRGQRFDRRHTAEIAARKPLSGLKPKDLMMVPSRVALALQADGWWLRSEIIWHKPNPMPESVTDRPTSAHEKLFLFAKSEVYFYDVAAVREPFADARQGRDYKMPDGWATHPGGHGSFHRDGREKGRPARERNRGGRSDGFTKPNAVDPSANGGRNLRNVWTIPSQPFPEAHFATFPPALVEPCIKAGCPKGGTVLDPFGGAGTTGLVADRLTRSAILIELNPEYAEMARRRIAADAPLLAEVAS